MFCTWFLVAIRVGTHGGNVDELALFFAGAQSTLSHCVYRLSAYPTTTLHLSSRRGWIVPCGG